MSEVELERKKICIIYEKPFKIKPKLYVFRRLYLVCSEEVWAVAAGPGGAPGPSEIVALTLGNGK